MIIDGIAASEAIDTSGEILDVEGADISDLENGYGVINYEHRGDKDNGASANDIIGAVTFAKKIFSKDDAETDREKMYWEKIKLPFVYIKAELFNDEGHPGAIAAAALIRYYNRRKLPVLARFSVEGSTLEREGNTLKRTLARRVALTIKPANRSCYSGVISDSEQPEEVSKDTLKELARHEDPLYTKLGGHDDELGVIADDPVELTKTALENLKEYNELSKAISAGGYNAAPTSLSGGSALQCEEVSGTVKNCALAAVRDFRGKKGNFKQFLKMRLPEVSDAFIDHFTNLVSDYHVKKAQELQDILNNSLPLKKAIAVNDEGEKVNPQEALVMTQNGKALHPNVAVTTPVFNLKNGTLHTPKGSFKLYDPSKDESPPADKQGGFGESKNASEEFSRLLKDPQRVRFHDEATGNWLKVHKLIKSGNVPEELAMHATLFSMLSPNTPVPVQELMYAHLVDAMKESGIDARDPAFKKLKKLWISKDSPSELPKTAHDYFEKEIPSLVRIQGGTTATGRETGDIASYQLAASKFPRMAAYNKFHGGIMEIAQKHKADTLSAVDEILQNKANAAKGDKSAWPIVGLAPKTSVYAYSMMGGGNSFVPDTHFIRYMFGLNPKIDAGSIDYVKRIMWNPKNVGLLKDMNKWFDNHPAMQYVLGHKKFGKEFEGNEENARFPAFWMNWLAIADHERFRGMVNRAKQEQTTHAPFWEAIAPITKSEDGNLAFNTAVLHRQWEDEYGEIPAQMLYFKYIVPQLLSAGQRKTVTKSEAAFRLSILTDKLQKASEDMVQSSLPALPESTPPVGARKFKGKFIMPGEVELLSGPYQGSKLPLLGQDNYQFYVGGEGDMPSSLPYHMVGKAFKINSYHQPVPNPVYVDATKHSHPANLTPDQLSLIHGINIAKKPEREANAMDSNTERNRPGEAGWTKSIVGKNVYIKPNAELNREYPFEKELPFATRETVYYNLARNFFGLGNHVMPTATFSHPETGELWSAMERVPAGEHFALGHERHRAVLNQLAHDGRMDKLALMDYFMGSRDRRRTNYMITMGDPQMYHVDNGLVLNYGKAYRPDYLDDYRQAVSLPHPIELQPIHPAAIQWMNGLNENLFANHLATNGVPGDLIQQAVQRMKVAKASAAMGRQNWGQIWNSNYYGDEY